MSNNKYKDAIPKVGDCSKSKDSRYCTYPDCGCNADVVENKQTVEEDFNDHFVLLERLANNQLIREFSSHLIAELKSRGKYLDYDAIKFITDDYIGTTTPTQSIEGIVGFVLEAAKYAYDYHANSQFPEMSFEDNCKNNLLQWMQGKGYTDRTQHNHASFVALVEGEIQQVCLDLLNNGSDEMEEVYKIELRVLTDLLTKIKL